jgi:lysophospholipid acyltransferase (LPLAT)-like uncharacterized protein
MAGATQNSERRTPKKYSGVVVPHPLKWHGRLAAWLICLLLRGLAATVRFKVDDPGGYFSATPQEKLIFAIWHNRLALSMTIYHRFVARRDRDRRLVALVSASRDGGIASRVLELFRVQPVRGSSSRRGPQALRELVTWAVRGHDLALTPDGPRGPRYVVQEGVISAAQLTGQPIVPVAYRLKWKICLKSWDAFQIPLPFTRCDLSTAPALRVPREATEEQREQLRLELERRLKEITRD